MATSMESLFSPTPFKSTKSNVPTSANAAISKATTLQDENPLDSITGPLRKRKRRKVAQDLHERGIEPGTPEYFKEFRDTLIEFGDMEGAETVEAKRIEQEQTEIKNRQTESLIGNRENLAKNRDANTELRGVDIASKAGKRVADISRDLAKLQDTDAKIKIMQQNANTSEQRANFDGIRTAIAQRMESLNADLKRSQVAQNKARTDRLVTETAFLDENGRLPSRSAKASAASASGAKVATALKLITTLETNLKDAAADGGTWLPGDPVSGIEGSLRASFGGLLRQLSGGKIDINTQAVSQRQSYEYLGSLLVPILLNEKKVTDPDRVRVDKITGRLKAASDNKQAMTELANLRNYVNGMRDLEPGETNDDQDDDKPDLPTPQTQEEFDALKPGDVYIDPDDGQEYVK
jgi:hypothetical protein